MQETGVFPLAGIRVRAHPMPHYFVADGHPKNAFVDMVLRMGEGRSDATKSEVGAFLMARAEAVFAPLLAESIFCAVFGNCDDFQALQLENKQHSCADQCAISQRRKPHEICIHSRGG